MNIKKHIPNVLTLANLLCGILAIKVGFSEHYYLAGFFVIFGAVFDFFDGFAARLLNVQGEIGKQLDSLADMVTFGVAPGVVMYSFLNSGFPHLSIFDYVLPFIAFLIPLLSAVRLAKFNIATNQSDKFIGLPTPANALFFVTIPMIYIPMVYGSIFPVQELFGIVLYEEPMKMIEEGWLTNIAGEPNFELNIWEGYNYFIEFILSNDYAIIIEIGLFSYLLNAPIEMIALKFKSFGLKGNEIRFIFLGLSLVVILLSLLISSVFVSVPIIILLYIVLSVVNNLFKKNKNELQS